MTIDWSQYLAEDTQEEGLVAPEEAQASVEESQQEPIDWSQYLSEESQTPFQKFQRHAARTGSRVAETIVGLPGDIIQLAKFVSEKLPEPPEFLKREPSFLQKAGKKALESIPTSQDLKEISQELTKGYTAPQDEKEAFADDIVSLATSLALPTKNPTKIKNVLSSVGKAVLAKTAGKGAEALGAEEGGQFAAEMGTLFLLGLKGAKSANKYVSEMYNDATEKIPKGTIVPTNKLTSKLTSVRNELEKGISTATKKEVLSAVSDLEKKSLRGHLEAEELVESFHNINEKMNAKKLFDEMGAGERKLLKHRYDLLKDAVRDDIKEYGKFNPSFYDQWEKANEAYATIKKSKTVSSYLESKLGKLPKHLATGIAVEIFLGYPKAAAATAGAAGAVKAGELLYRIASSKTLAKHYGGVIKAATDQNLPALINELNKLEEGLKNKTIK